ncbi:di/tricarboxylate transporter [Limimaricola variabilis]|uniref:Di/tricarboxylate transporter n=1 Tax=Limimaricola variabilis TaxID=1492771 RepID=A0ABR6HS50_9RHOB|nr:SLC13 family permease [Limimaricola variabilis]MBB3713388.1 di/tricarboxylate transporter [Limimaricola variabilis]
MTEIIAGYEPYLSFVLLLLLFAGFVTERYPPEVTAAGGAALFIGLGLVPSDDVLAAFANPAPITIAAMFVVSGALVRTGLLDAVANRVVAGATNRPSLGIAAFLLATLLASGLMNNTPVVLILIPVVVRLAQSLDIAATRLLIPLSYTAVLGGTWTLVGTSTNLLVAGVTSDLGMEPFSMFEIMPVGLVATVGGGLTLLVLGPLLLPRRREAGDIGSGGEAHFLTELRPCEGYAGLGQPINEVPDLDRPDIHVHAIRAQSEIKRSNLEEHRLEVGDRIVASATTSELLTLRDLEGMEVGLRHGPRDGEEVAVAEAVVTLSGRGSNIRLARLALGHRYGMRVLGVHRHGQDLGPDLPTVLLRPADKLLVEGTAEGLARLTQAGDLAAITQASARAYRRQKAPLALLALIAVMSLAALGVAEISLLVLMAVAAILLLRCIDSEEAWSSIDGGILVLIFSMLIISAGLQHTGAMALMVAALVPLIQDLPPVVILGAIYLLTSLLTETVTNNAVAVIITPIAIGLASHLGLDPRPFAVAVMFGASASFATPIGYQTNTLVYGAGNYRFTDFLKIGVPMNLIVGAVSVAVIPIFFPF